MHGQVTHAQSLHSLNVCHLFPPMLEVLFSFLVHTFSGGISRVASAMSSPRSRSPMRTTSVHDDAVPKLHLLKSQLVSSWLKLS